ncbi:MAG: leucine-rich repeat domain-containing protein [Planctomycetota bacterium]
MFRAFIASVLLSLLSCLCSGEAPCIDSKAIKDRFATITKADMDLLRTKKILWASRSFGLNTFGGLSALAQKDAKYKLLDSYKRYDVFKAGGDLSAIPVDAFKQSNIVHFLATYWPHTKRIEEMDNLLRKVPHDFGKIADAVIIYFHTAAPASFETYATKMDALRSDFPKIRFIYVTAGFMGPKMAKNNEEAHAFSELVRARYRGKVPIYDMGAILSDDFRAGHVYCPEYSKDPADVHPDLPLGQEMLAKGFLLVMHEAFRWNPSGATTEKIAGAKEAKVEILPADHPESKAVRAILDANGLTAKQVDAVSVVRKGHIVELFLQEGGVTEIPDAIGTLTELERLHVYGDRNLTHPLLQKISPEIGKCVKLQDLLLNNNELTTLPPEIVKLTKLKSLSIADNRLNALPPAVLAWAKKFDAKGVAAQLPTEATAPK